MLDGKSLGLGQGFAGDHGHMNLGPAAPPIKHQIVDLVRGQTFQPGLDLASALGDIGAGGMNLRVQDHFIWQNQLGRQTARRQAQCRGPQIGQCVRQIRGVQRRSTNLLPATRGAMQQRNGTVAEIKGKGRFHLSGLTHP